MICRHKLYHFTVANTRFTAPLTRRSKTKFATIKWYNLCRQIIQSQTFYPLSHKYWCHLGTVPNFPIIILPAYSLSTLRKVWCGEIMYFISFHKAILEIHWLYFLVTIHLIWIINLLVSTLLFLTEIYIFFIITIKYTWAPQTVHNTPVMNILKGYLLYNSFLKETH